MKLTKKIIIFALINYFLLCVFVGVYEIITLCDNVPNNTISHVVADWSQTYTWLPTTCVVFGGLFVAFWLTVFLHWWGRNFWWKPAVFIKKEMKKRINK